MLPPNKTAINLKPLLRFFPLLFFNRDVDEFSSASSVCPPLASAVRNLFDLPRLIYVPPKKLSSGSLVSELGPISFFGASTYDVRIEGGRVVKKCHKSACNQCTNFADRGGSGSK